MTALDNFIDVPFSVGNLDRYSVRSAILKAITNHLPHFRGRLLDAGCGKMPYKTFILGNSQITEYVGLDIESAKVYDKNVKVDYTWDGKVMPFSNACFDCTMATEVLEHCPDPDSFLREVHRVLKPNGLFFFTVPFLWNLHEVPHDEYRYTPFSLERHLKNSGFTNIQLQATGGWHASMAQMMGLWVRRSKLNRYLKTGLSLFFMPIIRILLNLDSRSQVNFKEGVMITGLYGTATKG